MHPLFVQLGMYGYGGLGMGEVLVILFIALIIFLAIYIPFLLNLQRTVEAVSPECRRLSPGQVWLTLIPIFSWFWIFIMVRDIADSLDQEYRRRNIMSEPRPTYQMGITFATLSLSSSILNLIPNPFFKLIAGLASLTGFVFFILYWVKTAEHKRNLQQMNMGGFGGYNPGYNQQQYNPYNQQQPYNPNNQQFNQQYNQQQYQNPNQQFQNPGSYNQNPQNPPQNPNDPNRWAPPGGDGNQNNNNPNNWQPPQGPPTT